MSRPRLTLTHTRRIEARREMAKTSNSIAVAATAHLTRLPDADNDYWKDLRRGRRWVWGGLLRWVDACVRVRAPLSAVLWAIDAVRCYAIDAYGESDPPTLCVTRSTPPAPVRRAA